jgi:hypothetical protein
MVHFYVTGIPVHLQKPVWKDLKNNSFFLEIRNMLVLLVFKNIYQFADKFL